MKIASILFLSAALVTPNPKTEYVSFMDDFMKNNNVSFDFKITQYQGQISQSTVGYYKRSNNEFLIKNEDYLVISNTQYSLTILEKDKLIFLDDPKPANNLFVMDAKEMSDAIEKVTEIPSTLSGKKEWHVLGKQWDGLAVVKADYINKVPEQISIYPKLSNIKKDKPAIRINFSNVWKSEISSEVFNTSNILTKKGKQWVLSPKYSKYELFNNLD